MSKVAPDCGALGPGPESNASFRCRLARASHAKLTPLFSPPHSRRFPKHPIGHRPRSHGRRQRRVVMEHSPRPSHRTLRVSKWKRPPLGTHPLFLNVASDLFKAHSKHVLRPAQNRAFFVVQRIRDLFACLRALIIPISSRPSPHVTQPMHMHGSPCWVEETLNSLFHHNQPGVDLKR